MIYGSVCSGIEAASVAWEPLGWTPAWFAEIEPFPSAVLASHWPHVINHGDMTKLVGKALSGLIVAPDVLVGGTPCQAFSVAGMRAGLDDPRGALTLKYVELADAIDHVRAARGDAECIIVWENVPGVLSDKGNAFGCFLGALVGESDALQPSGGRWTDAGCVYGPVRSAAWRVLDAQYFGLAQRRRRVFVVASARAGLDPAAVLFESDSMRRDSAPSREAGKGAAAGTLRSTDGGSHANAGVMPAVAYPLLEVGKRTGVSTTDPRAGIGIGDETDPMFTLQAAAQHGVALSVHGTQDPDIRHDQAHTLGRNSGQENAVLAFQSSQSGVRVGETHATLDANNGPRRHNGALVGMAVRRLTPTECERLQGFPDGHTQIPWRGRPADECPDGPRYKAIGNSKAVPVVRWIGMRIQRALTMQQEAGHA